MERTFTRIYDKNIWGGGSGKGSGVLYNKKYIRFLEDMIHNPENKIKTVLDLGCGDWTFSRTVDWKNIEYHGVDCVKSVVSNNKQFEAPNIKFTHQDFTIEPITGKYDLIILKDVLQHWSNENIITFMDSLIKQGDYRFILIINGWMNAPENRSIDNRYCYSKLDVNKYPLNKYHPEVLFNYQYKQVSLIRKCAVS